jgi:ACT domain-containing protein
MTSLQILTQEEVKIFNAVPVLSNSEQKYYFKIPNNLLENIETNMNQIYFIALFGYFKKENKFFEKFDNQIYLYIAHEILNIEFTSEDINIVSKSTFYRYKEIIKNYFAMQAYTGKTANILLKEATTLASNFTHRKKIFYALVDLSKKLKIEVPSYSELSKIISLAINSQKQDILDKLTPFIKDEKLNVLDEFLQKDTSTKNRWNLVQYKKLEHATNKKKMIASLARFNTIKSKF